MAAILGAQAASPPPACLLHTHLPWLDFPYIPNELGVAFRAANGSCRWLFASSAAAPSLRPSFSSAVTCLPFAPAPSYLSSYRVYLWTHVEKMHIYARLCFGLPLFIHFRWQLYCVCVCVCIHLYISAYHGSYICPLYQAVFHSHPKLQTRFVRKLVN